MRKDLFFFAGGAVLTALAVQYATNSLLWSVIFYAGLVVMIGSLIDWYRRSARRMWWMDTLIIVGVVGSVAGCVWSFSAAPFPGWQKQTQPQPPSQQPQASAQPKLSRFGKYIYQCQGIGPSDPEKYKSQKEKFAKAAQALGETLGLKFDLADITGGVALDISAATSDGKIIMGPYANRWRIELRRLDDDTALVAVVVDALIPEPLNSIFKLTPVEEDKSISDFVDKLVGHPCRIL